MLKLKNLRTILLSGFSLIILLLTITCAVSWYFLINAQKVAALVEKDDVPSAFLYSNLLRNASNMQTSVLEYLSGEVEEITGFANYHIEFESDFTTLLSLESDNVEDAQKMGEIRSLMEEYRTQIQIHVFDVFAPADELWAFTTASNLIKTTGTQLEALLDQQTEEDFADAMRTVSIEETINDDLPGVRYYMEMVDEAGDMLSTLIEYVAGDKSGVAAFKENSESFLEYFNLLLPLEKEPQEVENLNKIKNLYNKINETANEIFIRYKPDSKIIATKHVDLLEHDLFYRLITLLRNSAYEGQIDTTNSLVSLSNGINSTILVLISATISSAILGIMIALILSRTILSALANVMKISELISLGNMQHAKEKIEQEKYLTKNEDKQIQEFENVRLSLSQALDGLIEASEANEKQDWLKTGVTDLNNRLRGELPVAEITKNSIDFIAQYIDASVAFIYRTQLDKEDNSYVTMTAHYGVSMSDTNKNLFPENYTSGEGLVGQCLLQRRIICKKISPEHRTPIVQSGISRATPTFVIVAPLMFEESVEGVIELGVEYEPGDKELELISQVTPNLGIAMRVATSRDRMKQLLMQSQTQAEELEQQQSALGYSNDKLKEKAQELAKQQEVLQEKNKALKQTQKDLERQATELVSSNKYKSEFLANMSHELRSPLNSLLILANLLQENAEGNLTEKQISYAQVIYRSGTSLLSLINDILDLSKIEAGKMDLYVENVLLDEFIGQISDLFTYMADDKGIEFTIVNNTQLEFISTDSKRLLQIIVNLVSNAIKFTNQGSVTLTISEVSANSPDMNDQIVSEDMLCYQVVDTGIGIPKDKLNDVFEAFCQGDGAANRRYEGTGLGLSISLQLAQLLSGYILIDSEIEQGTTLALYLPKILDITTEYFTTDDQPLIANSEIPENLAIALEQPTHSTEMPTFTNEDILFQEGLSEKIGDCNEDIQDHSNLLLVIESDPQIQLEIKKQGQQAGYHVVAAFDGGIGLQIAEQLKPTAIILDEDSVYIDGKMILNKLTANIETRHIPVYIIASEETLAQAQLKGAQVVSNHPIDINRIHYIFERMEKFKARESLDILIYANQETTRNELTAFLDAPQVIFHSCDNFNNFEKSLGDHQIDCIVISVDNEVNLTWIEDLLQEISQATSAPTLIHSNSPLPESQKQELNRIIKKHRVVAVFSNDSLLIETTLFLHQVSQSLTKRQQELLRQQLHSTDVYTGKNLLVVDDKMSNIFALTAVLETNGMHCTIANNGFEALALIDNGAKVDLIIMDIMMPKMDGYETMKRIREMPEMKSIPIIALTAKAEREERSKCLKSGANDYLPKPLNSNKLMKVLKIWLVSAPSPFDLSTL